MIGDLTGNLTDDIAQGWPPSLTDKVANLTGVFGMHDPYDASKLFTDETGATQAVIGSTVGLVRDASAISVSNSMVQATAQNRPTLIEETIGSNPLAVRALRYDGVNNFMIMDFPGGSGPSDGSFLFKYRSTDTVFIYARGSSDAGKYVFYGDSGTGAPYAGAGTPEIFVDGVQYTQQNTLSAASSDNNWHIGEAKGGDFSSWTSLDVCAYGGPYRMQADIARAIHCNTSTLNANRGLILNWLNEGF